MKGFSSEEEEKKRKVPRQFGFCHPPTFALLSTSLPALHSLSLFDSIISILLVLTVFYACASVSVSLSVFVCICTWRGVTD